MNLEYLEEIFCVDIINCKIYKKLFIHVVKQNVYLVATTKDNSVCEHHIEAQYVFKTKDDALRYLEELGTTCSSKAKESYIDNNIDSKIINAFYKGTTKTTLKEEK